VIVPGQAMVIEEPEEPEAEEEVEEEVPHAAPWLVTAAGRLGVIHGGAGAAVPVGVDVAAARTVPTRHGDLRLGGALGLAAVPWQHDRRRGTSGVATPRATAALVVPRGAWSLVAEGGLGVAVLSGLEQPGHPMVGRVGRVDNVVAVLAVHAGAAVEWIHGGAVLQARLGASLLPASEGMASDAFVELAASFGIGFRP
jgi:hypothetical protein